MLAGAGSGKTRVLTYRIAHLVSELGVSPRRILAVTFTNKAAGEMKRRVGALVGAGLAPHWIGTFHSMCARILRAEARWAWWTPGFSIFDETDQLDLIKESMKRAGVATTSFAPRAILGAISRAKDRLLTADSYAASQAGYFEECVARVYEEYEKGLVENNALDFDDLIMKAVGLMRAHPPVLEAYSGRFEHVLVDEYQDTSHAQYELVNLLSSSHRNICVVGDDDQSIYGWRGADISNILDFEKDHPDAAVMRLEQNYRSTRSILAAAHDVVSHNVRRKEKELWTERPLGRKPLLSRVFNEYEEADRIRDRITQLMMDRGLSYHDFAVLYRTHAQSRVIEDSLRRAGIAYDIVGGVRFYERAEVKDVLAYLRVVANPADSVSFRRIVNVPPRKVGDRTLERLQAHADRRGIGLLQAAGEAGDIDGVPPAATRSLEGLVGALSSARRSADGAPVDEVLRGLLDSSGYLAWLGERKDERSIERVANVEELVSAASEFVEMSGDPGLDAFLSQVALVANIDRWEDRTNAVSLMTLHNAKGLEFTAVLIPGLEEGLLPHESSFDDEEELEEERRLFYVGMTRAIDELHFCAADTRRRGGVSDIRAVSRFVDEIDPDHIEVEAVETRSWTRGVGGRTTRGRRRATRREFEDYSQEEVALNAGTRVTHPAWGDGVVVEVAGSGLDTVVRVRFADDTEKRIMVRYGKLEIVED